ncbi:MAG: ADP-ribosylglycohydrolase family protein [Sphaerochaetaceae bacterium]|nr:ADP-ribosylglycohydrolase family protein [Sphaerochaetaceae bacterium]
MMTKDELKRNSELIQDKACGALSGLAIGDSFGDAARMQANRANYGFITDFNSGASWSTDDTEFALLTANTLINCEGKLTSQDVVDAWMKDVVVQDEFSRGGQSEIQAAKNLKKGLRPPQSGQFNTFHMSDGTAMRIPPVGIVCAGDPERAAKMARIDAEISHYRDGVWGAQAVAVAVSLAMVDADWDEIFEGAMNVIDKDSWLYYSMNKAFEIVDENNGNIIDCWMKLHDELRCSTWATTAEAIPAAFACLKLEHSSFKKGLILAGNFARDADTIGAVAGSILGAKYGLKSIPSAWVEKTRYPSGTCLNFTKGKDILKMGKQLAALI